MAFDEKRLLEVLETLGVRKEPPSRLVVGFSGGMDSSSLLYALAHAALGIPIRALHVDHRLHPDSDSWRVRAETFSRRLGVDYTALVASVDTASGRGPEAAARDARYRLFRDNLEPGDWLLTAQHQDDQAETLLINLLRGSGPLGLAGMPDIRPFGSGKIVRPLLGVPRDELRQYARDRAIEWLDDPSNEQLGADRNFLRHRVLPRLRDRWPEASASLARSAAHAAEAQALLDDIADLDLATVSGGDPMRLRIERLSALEPRRQRNLVRRACQTLGVPRPPAARLDNLLATVLHASLDAEPLVSWEGAEARRFRGELFLLPRSEAGRAEFSAVLRAGESVDLGPSLGRLSLAKTAGPGIPADLAEKGLTLAPRQGGERIRIAARGRSQRLKKLLQAEGVLPWVRDTLPLLKDQDRLVAVADRWIDADIAATPGYRVVWTNPPIIE